MASIFIIKVVPQAGKQHCILDKQNGIKCYLKSPAQDQKANQELLKIIAKAVGCTLQEVAIIMGAQSRTKTIKIERDITREEFLEKLGIEKQYNFLS